METQKIKFKTIITNYTDFENLIVSPILASFMKSGEISAEFLNESEMFLNYNQIYFFISRTFNERFIRYDTMEEFLNYFQFDFVSALSRLYLKQLAWINKELSILKSYTKRDAEDVKTSTYGHKIDDANSSEDGASDGRLFADDESTTEKSAQSHSGTDIENTERYDIKSDLEKIMNANFDFAVDEFLDYLSVHFIKYSQFDLKKYLENNYF